MSSIEPRPASVRPTASLAGPPWRALAEWAVWMAIAGLAWSQTVHFDRPIPGYDLGATSWPRAVCLMIAIGATAQLAFRIGSGQEAPAAVAETGERRGRGRRAQALAIFALPFAFVWLAPLAGFYLTAPLFVIALLLLLEVRSPLAILGVTGAVWGLLLLLFTRFFYVALPVGRLDPFYEINATIIDVARWGV